MIENDDEHARLDLMQKGHQHVDQQRAILAGMNLTAQEIDQAIAPFASFLAEIEDGSNGLRRVTAWLDAHFPQLRWSIQPREETSHILVQVPNDDVAHELTGQASEASLEILEETGELVVILPNIASAKPGEDAG
jgi:hypothetical protein